MGFPFERAEGCRHLAMDAQQVRAKRKYAARLCPMWRPLCRKRLPKTMGVGMDCYESQTRETTTRQFSLNELSFALSGLAE